MAKKAYSKKAESKSGQLGKQIGETFVPKTALDYRGLLEEAENLHAEIGQLMKLHRHHQNKMRRIKDKKKPNNINR